MYRLLYVNLMVTTSQKSVTDTPKREGNPNITLMIVKSQGKRAKKGATKNYKNNSKTINRMAVSTYLSITLTVLNAQIRRQ